MSVTSPSAVREYHLPGQLCACWSHLVGWWYSDAFGLDLSVLYHVTRLGPKAAIEDWNGWSVKSSSSLGIKTPTQQDKMN